jgi:uncharacterized small protein (DUF1192 family)
MRHRRVLSVSEIQNRVAPLGDPVTNDEKENTFEYDELIRLIKGLKAELKAKTETEEVLLQKIEKLR